MTEQALDPAFDQALNLAEELGLWAIEHIRSREPGEVSTKDGPADFVTDVDRAVELHVREQVAARFPDHTVVGEEFGGRPHGPSWYVDPIDGTTNYAHGLPWSSFSLALTDDAGLAVGVVADPWRGELFSAARGGGARCNGRRIRCSQPSTLAGAVVLTELAGHRVWPGLLPMIDRLAAAQATVRMLGSSALAVATVAAGRGDAVVLGGYHTWDVAAGVLIGREAGLTLTRRDGGELPAIPGADDGGLLGAAPAVAAAVHATLG